MSKKTIKRKPTKGATALWNIVMKAASAGFNGASDAQLEQYVEKFEKRLNKLIEKRSKE